MTIATNLGFPRMGVRRELKRAVEGFWQGSYDLEELQSVAASLRQRHWQLQRDAGIEHVPCGDFSLYDHVLDTVAMVGAVPRRFRCGAKAIDLPSYFSMARGTQDAPPLDMTKWFDTNYHCLTPEFEPQTSFRLSWTGVIDAFVEAKALGISARPVLLGPVSFLLLGKSKAAGVEPLRLLDRLLPVYEEVIRRLAKAGAEWIQIDEPVLTLDLPDGAAAAFDTAYGQLADVSAKIKICLATYFGALGDNLAATLRLPVAAVHLDLVRSPEQLDQALELAPAPLALSLGVIDGRNVWRADLDGAFNLLEKAAERLGRGRLMVGPSCSLLHCPIDLDEEKSLDAELRGWMAFAKQKLGEIAVLARGLREGARRSPTP